MDCWKTIDYYIVDILIVPVSCIAITITITTTAHTLIYLLPFVHLYLVYHGFQSLVAYCRPLEWGKKIATTVTIQ
jgi:hypothetical protein